MWHLLLPLQNTKPELAFAVGAEPYNTYQLSKSCPSGGALSGSLIIDGINRGIDDYHAD